MTPTGFADALRAYCAALGGSVTSWGRTKAHNERLEGVAGSPHRWWMGADVVYDELPALAFAKARAKALGLLVLREPDHDHLQPLDWPPG